MRQAMMFNKRGTSSAEVTAAIVDAFSAAEMPWVEPHPPLASGVSTFSANEATLHRFRVSRSITVTKISIFVGTASGNIDAGLYQSDGTTLTLLAAAGSTAMSGANAAQTLTLTSAVTLVPGVDYYIAFTIDNATGTIRKLDGGGAYVGLENRSIKKAATFPLPASITLASTAATGWMMNIMARP